MYGYSDHSHRGEYAEERHDHREIDEERWDRQRADEETRRELYDTARGIRADLDFSDLWGAISELQEQVMRLAKQVGEGTEQAISITEQLTTMNEIIGEQGREIRALGRRTP